MLRFTAEERANWKATANEFGFKFHTMYGEPYWDESVYYQFTLQQIENGIEDPTEEIHQMCLEVVSKVVADDELMRRFQIPKLHWDLLRNSWMSGQESLYSRIDLAYDGKSPAKLYENNADTPTSLYETGFWQWVWLEDMIHAGRLGKSADQFNSLQEKVIDRFFELAIKHPNEVLHFSCCQDTEEDRGTVQYIEDCANEAGIHTKFVYIEDIGVGKDEDGREVFTDTDDQIITWMFKLYPWEFMLREEFAEFLVPAKVSWLEPAWKAIISNKALLPLLWKMFPNHPNLLPAYFEDELAGSNLENYVKKPIFAREGSNVSIHMGGKEVYASDGPYGEEGFIYQEYHPLPRFEDNYTLIGSWLINDKAAGISVREDKNKVTQDLSRYIPHIIL